MVLDASGSTPVEGAVTLSLLPVQALRAQQPPAPPTETITTAATHTPTEQQVIDWCRDTMAVYKAPKIVEFAEALPKSGSGKVMWRQLQEAEAAAPAAAEAPAH